MRSLTFHSFCSINYYFPYYSRGEHIFWGRGGARSHDSADTLLFKKGGRMGEISLFLFFKINHRKKAQRVENIYRCLGELLSALASELAAFNQ